MRALLLLLLQLLYLSSEIKTNEALKFAFPADVENLGCFKIQSVRNSSNFDGLYDSLDHCLVPCKLGVSRYFTVHKVGDDNPKQGQLMASTSHHSEKRSLNYVCLCGINLENVLQKVNISQCECCFNESNCTDNTLCGSLDSGSTALYKVREFNTNDKSPLVPKDAEYLGCFNKSVTNASNYSGTTGLDDCLQPCTHNLWRYMAINEMASYTHPRPREFSCLCRKDLEFQNHLRKFSRKECQCCSDEHNCINNNICGLSDFGTVSVYKVKASDSTTQVSSDPSKPDIFENEEDITESTEQEGSQQDSLPVCLSCGGSVNVTTPPKQGETNNDLSAADNKHSCNNSSTMMPTKKAENDLLNSAVKNTVYPNTNKTNLANQTLYQTISIIEKVTYFQVNITGTHEIWNTLNHLRNFSGFS